MSRPKSKLTTTVTFGLSFLDVLSCGLGAATLLLLIVKHGPATDPEVNLDFLSTRITEVETNLTSLEQTKEDLLVQLAVSDEEIESQIASKSASSQLEADRIAAVSKLLDQLSDARKELATSQAQLQQAQKNKQLASLKPDLPHIGNKGDLIGLKIEKSRVAILLDRSASMLDAELVEIIRLRVSSDGLKRAAGKWVTARQAAEWAYLQIEDGNQYQLLTYSDSVRDLAGNSYTRSDPIQWRLKDTDQDYRTSIPALKEIVPNGATDLRTAFEIVGNLSPPPVQVVLITDGYPTLPGNRNLTSLRDCPRKLPGVTPFLSPSCRVSVFLNATNVAERRFKNTRIDTILFPLEGDANAVQGYWMLSATSGGRLLTPAPGWPYL